MTEFKAPGEELYNLDFQKARREWLIQDVLKDYDSGKYTVEDVGTLLFTIGFSEGVRAERENVEYYDDSPGL